MECRCARKEGAGGCHRAMDRYLDRKHQRSGGEGAGQRQAVPGGRLRYRQLLLRREAWARDVPQQTSECLVLLLLVCEDLQVRVRLCRLGPRSRDGFRGAPECMVAAGG